MQRLFDVKYCRHSVTTITEFGLHHFRVNALSRASDKKVPLFNFPPTLYTSLCILYAMSTCRTRGIATDRRNILLARHVSLDCLPFYESSPLHLTKLPAIPRLLLNHPLVQSTTASTRLERASTASTPTTTPSFLAIPRGFRLPRDAK